MACADQKSKIFPECVGALHDLAAGVVRRVSGMDQDVLQDHVAVFEVAEIPLIGVEVSVGFVIPLRENADQLDAGMDADRRFAGQSGNETIVTVHVRDHRAADLRAIVRCGNDERASLVQIFPIRLEIVVLDAVAVVLLAIAAGHAALHVHLTDVVDHNLVSGLARSAQDLFCDRAGRPVSMRTSKNSNNFHGKNSFMLIYTCTLERYRHSSAVSSSSSAAMLSTM